MRRIIVTNITYDMTTRKPAYVVVAIFDRFGVQQMSFTWPGVLFSDDVKIHDELVLIPREKMQQVESLAKLGRGY